MFYFLLINQVVKSMYDEHKEKIEELYKLGLSVQKIVKYIGVGTQPSLKSWIKKQTMN